MSFSLLAHGGNKLNRDANVVHLLRVPGSEAMALHAGVNRTMDTPIAQTLAPLGIGVVRQKLNCCGFWGSPHTVQGWCRRG
jgi:hypothetical protein